MSEKLLSLIVIARDVKVFLIYRRGKYNIISNEWNVQGFLNLRNCTTKKSHSNRANFRPRILRSARQTDTISTSITAPQLDIIYKREKECRAALRGGRGLPNEFPINSWERERPELETCPENCGIFSSRTRETRYGFRGLRAGKCGWCKWKRWKDENNYDFASVLSGWAVNGRACDTFVNG